MDAGALGRGAKRLIGLALLPAAAGVARALGGLLAQARPESLGGVPISLWGLALGFHFWLFLYFALPRPVRAYVLAHELTHALWALLFGARVSGLKVGAGGGRVRVSKTNFLITLAPYFFPLYTLLVLAARALLRLRYNLHATEPLWLGLIGLTWGFHLTFTVAALARRQPDIREQGRLFSYVIIFLFNLLGVGVWIAAATQPTVADFLRAAARESAVMYHALPPLFREGIARLTAQ